MLSVEGLPMGDGVVLAGRYRVGALVGRGAMAEVHRGYDLRLERPVAIKRFTANGALDRQRFVDEARLLASLTHPGLVTLYEAGHHEGIQYLVMQLVNGPSLYAALEREKPTLDEVLALGRHLLPTLAYVHGRGVVHRDVKPSNILVDLDGAAYLADFGLARLVEAAGITRTGEIVGTAAYLAPEQVRGEAVTTAADVYALGLVLLQCITGRQEFEGTQTESALARLTRNPVIPAGLPRSLTTLLAEMTHADPLCRPAAQDCATRWDAIDAVDVTAPAPRRRSRVIAAGTAGMVALGLGLITALQQPEPAAPVQHIVLPPTTTQTTPTPASPTTASPTTDSPTTISTTVGLAASATDAPPPKPDHDKKPKPSKHK
jgi:serine/threonine protein kinase